MTNKERDRQGKPDIQNTDRMTGKTKKFYNIDTKKIFNSFKVKNCVCKIFFKNSRNIFCIT